MIQNEHQYKVTQNKLKDLEKALDELFQVKDTLHPRKFSSRKNGLQMMIDSLRKEIEEYDALKQQELLLIWAVSSADYYSSHRFFRYYSESGRARSRNSKEFC